jgi:hypothetical protein
MKISEALYIVGGHLQEDSIIIILGGLGINTISGPFEFKKMVHKHSYI